MDLGLQLPTCDADLVALPSGITTKHYLVMRKVRILIRKIHSRVRPSFADRHTVTTEK